MTCIMCPLGCQLDVQKVGNKYKVTGNNCVRGERYGIDEMTNPTRVVTSLVKTKYGVLPCKTTAPVPKKVVFKVLEEIGKIRLVNGKLGDVIIKNVCRTGVDVVITGNKLPAEV